MGQCFAMFIDKSKVDFPMNECLKMINVFYKELKKYPSIKMIKTYADILQNQKENTISAILTIEEGEVISGDISMLRIFYRLGVRMICLCWNHQNSIGTPSKIGNLGLTHFGKSLIQEMNRLGIIIDVSHLSDQGFWDVVRLSDKPIVASHSNARALCRHHRNLSDEMIIALYKNGGVMGLNYYPLFLDEELDKGAHTISALIRQMKYIREIAGIEVIALGSDFDGIDGSLELDHAGKLPKLIKEMELEFSKEEIEAICYKNALRVFQMNLK